MNRQELTGILERINTTTVGVFGDYCLDAYWDLDTGDRETSIETGKPARAVLTQRYSPGGAGNIASNLADIGCQSVRMYGVIGDDMFGRELERLLGQHSALQGPLILQPQSFHTPVYAKPYRGEEEQERIDFGRHNNLARESEAGLIAALHRDIANLGALIINQQLPGGVCTSRLISELNLLATQFPRKIFLFDARDQSDLFHNMIRKLNAAEAVRLHGSGGQEALDTEGLKECAEAIAESTNRPVFITRGHMGIVAFDHGEFHDIPAIEPEGEVDTVGAGDTTVAALAASLAAGATVREAAIVSNLAAGVTVQKLRQTGTATPQEILHSFGRWSGRG